MDRVTHMTSPDAQAHFDYGAALREYEDAVKAYHALRDVMIDLDRRERELYDQRKAAGDRRDAGADRVRAAREALDRAILARSEA
jgi:hypothetical protein